MDIKILENKIKIIQNKFSAGQFDEVISDAKLLLKKFSNQQILYNILSLTYQKKGENIKSIDLLTNAIKKIPNNIFFLNNLGTSYYNIKNFEEAEYYFKRALEINPKYITAINNLANLKYDLDLIDEAKKLYNQALELNNNLLEPNYNLASFSQSTGDFDKAIYHYKKVLKINPKFTKADRNISMMTKYSLENEHFIEMKNKLNNKNLNNFEKLELHFAIGKAYDDLKDYKESFSNIDYANSLKKEITKYSIKKDVKLFENIKKIFSLTESYKFTENKKKIIFILGMPRSGTSLVEQIIASHNNVYGGGEIFMLSKFFQNNIERDNQLNKDALIDFQNEYMYHISSIDSSNKSFTDKAPLNFRWIGFIISLFPNSKIVHCTRNKIDNCWSIYKNNFDSNINFSNDLEDLASYYNLYEDLMLFWNKKYSNKIYNLNYEDLIDDQNSQIKNLIKFCELDWDQNCLNFHKYSKIIKTVSFAQARKPIYKSSINISKNYSVYLEKLGVKIKS